MIKNAIIYRAELPPQEALATHLEELSYRELAGFEARRFCFVPSERTGQLVSDFPGGYAFQLRSDEKIIPPKLLKAEADRRASALEEETGRTLSRAERLNLRDELHAELLQTALVETRFTWAYYHEAERLLYVDTTRDAVADALMSCLVMVMGSVKTQTINISDVKNGLTIRVRRRLDGEEEALGCLGLGDSIKVVREGEVKETITYRNLELTYSHELKCHLDDRFKVTELRAHHGNLGFTLTEKFRLKKIRWIEPIEHDDESLFEDPAQLWRTDTLLAITALNEVVAELCRLLDYKMPDLLDDTDEESAA